jgi:hypothetical protein
MVGFIFQNPKVVFLLDGATICLQKHRVYQANTMNIWFSNLDGSLTVSVPPRKGKHSSLKE